MLGLKLLYTWVSLSQTLGTLLLPGMFILLDFVGVGTSAPLARLPGVLVLPLSLWVRLLRKGTSGLPVGLLDTQRAGKGGLATNTITGGNMSGRDRSAG